MTRRHASLLAGVLVLAACGGTKHHLKPGAQVDVSNALGLQAEVSGAIDPNDSRRLLVGSNDDPGMLVSSSRDGGVHWRSDVLPLPPAHAACASDPAVGIGPGGEQYYGFLALSGCEQRTSPAWLYVAHRKRGGRWRVGSAPVSEHGKKILDDRPALAVDTSGSHSRGRVYVAWVRGRASEEGPESLLFSASGDRGRHWSKPVHVDPKSKFPSDPSLAVAADGAVYLAWYDTGLSRVELARSTDGGRSFGPTRFVAQPVIAASEACYPYGTPIPAQSKRCISPVPVVAVDTSHGRLRGRVYVTFGGQGPNASQDVFVAAFDPELRPLSGTPRQQAFFPRISASEHLGPSDEFLPTAGVDPSNGRLWACFYVSGRGSSRQTATFRCTVSPDGGRKWSKLVDAASGASDQSRPDADPFEFGDYEGLAVARGTAHPFWTDTRNKGDKGEIFTTAISAPKAAPRVIAGKAAATGSAARFIKRGNKICSDFYVKQKAIPRPKTRRAAIADEKRLLTESVRSTDALAALRPPKKYAPTFREAVRLLRESESDKHQMIAAIEAHDATAEERWNTKENAAIARSNTMFARAGLFVCAQPGPPTPSG